MTVHINLISLPSCLQSVIYPYVILQILKFRMATFFGEVTELTSRAVWWSDSEDEDEADQEKKNDTPNVSFQSFVAEIMNKKSLENLSCKRLSVSISKNLAPLASDKCILRVKIEKDQQSIKGDIASLYQLNATDYWLVIDSKMSTEFGIWSSKLIDFIAENIFKMIKSPFELHLISKDLTRFDYLQYFGSAEGLSQLGASIEMQPLIAPETVKNEFESALLEYCIVNKLNFACFLLPASFKDRVKFIPREIIESITAFTELSYSNIIT